MAAALREVGLERQQRELAEAAEARLEVPTLSRFRAGTGCSCIRSTRKLQMNMLEHAQQDWSASLLALGVLEMCSSVRSCTCSLPSHEVTMRCTAL